MPNSTTVFEVDGMSCNHCVNSIKQAVGDLDGVTSVAVDLQAGQVTVGYTAGLVAIQTIRETIEDQGFQVK
jgi:copper chaperone